jgi:cytochrome c biogenesis protein CcmG/thiol:disulfide interchange protein DsbE
VLSWSALVLAVLTATASTGLAGIRYDAPSPNFAIPTPRSTQYLYGLRGRVVVVDFWATWCHACTDEMPYFVRAQQSYGGRVVVLTVSDEPHGVAAKYFRQSSVGLPVVEDPLGAISRLYSVAKIPVTLVLDPEGNVAYVSVGGLNWEELSTAIEQAASSQIPSTPAPRVLQ